MFRALDADGRGRIERRALIDVLRASGLSDDDPRVAPTVAALRSGEGDLDFAAFCRAVRLCSYTMERVLRGALVIPDFRQFGRRLEGIFEAARPRTEGHVATYIPQLARVDPEAYALAVCTVDGQRFAAGDDHLAFCAQSTCKPINYALALEEHGETVVHRHVGREPSGQRYNDLTLDPSGRPHNPMINAGAIMCCALIRPDAPMPDRFEHVMQAWTDLAGGQRPGFSNAVYQSERQNADRNFALGYFMREHRVFPPNTSLLDTLELYFQCCSIEVRAPHLAGLAATLANGGVVPSTGRRVLEPETVRAVLSLMATCGMYDFSGEFAFSIGFPAKSAVSGAIMAVVPNLMGLCVWSPRLDGSGNSVRGVDVCRRLVQQFNFHTFDNLTGLSGKEDPRHPAERDRDDHINLVWAAAKGDLRGIQRLVARGVDPAVPDYDGRTALHLAASEGRADVVAFLLSCGVPSDPRDRWGRTPADDARRAARSDIERLLAESGEASSSA